MEYIQRIETKLTELNITAKKMLLDLGYSDSLISTWKKGSEPSAIKLNRVANYLGVSIEYILNGTSSISLPALSENEYELLTPFRKLSERNQLKAIGKVEEVLSTQQEAEQTKENVG